MQDARNGPSAQADAKHGGPLQLVVDDREYRGRMAAALDASTAFAIEVRRLPAGDYCLDDALLFERKTLADLAASIKDGRLFGQALRLAKGKLPAALILEGNTRDLACSGMRVEAIRGALVTVSLFIGLPVLRTRDAEDTLRTLRYAAQQRRAATGSALPRHGHRPKSKAALQSYVLQGLPGIGPQRAARLIRRFGSIEATIAADADALADVDGIGPAIARKLRWAVEEPPGTYAARVRCLGNTHPSFPGLSARYGVAPRRHSMAMTPRRALSRTEIHRESLARTSETPH